MDFGSNGLIIILKEYYLSLMKQQLGKRYIISERSVPKDSSTPRITSTQSYFPGNVMKNYVDVGDSPYKGMDIRSPSQGDLRASRDEFNRTTQKKKNEVHMSNLKNELQNLKLQVSKLMTNNKTGLTKTPSGSEKKFFPSNMYQSGIRMDSSNQNASDNDFSDTQSVTSERVIYEPLKKLESKVSSQNYDHSYYMQMENELLKTQLRNLKNKYNAKKRQLNQKCQVLQKKNEYLQIHLHKSQQNLHECQRALESQVALIKKQLLKSYAEKQNQEEAEREKIPTKDSAEGSPNEQNELIKQKMKKLYEELSLKSKKIFELTTQIEECNGLIEKKTFQLRKQMQKTSELSKQLQFTKREQVRNNSFFQNEMNKKNELLQTIESLRQRNNELSSQIYNKEKEVKDSASYENTLSLKLEEYRSIEKNLNAELSDIKDQYKKLKQLTVSDQEEITYLKRSNDENLLKIEQLGRKIKDEQTKLIERQNYYKKTLEDHRKQEEQRINILREQYQNKEKLLISSPTSPLRISQKREVESSQTIKQLQKEIRKWKAEYKLLKGKHEQIVANQNSKQQESREYYKGFVQFKQKNEILQKRIRMLEKSLQKYLEMLGNKETEFIKKEIDLRKTQNELNKETAKTARQKQEIEEEFKILTEKYNEQVIKNEKQTLYRKEIEQKIYNFKLQDDAEDEIQEIIERMKKRVLDQDQKLSKNVKELKTKDILINKLKNQVKEIMENSEKNASISKNKQIDNLVNEFTAKTYDAFEQWKKNMQKQHQFSQERFSQMLNENCELKQKITNISKELIDLKQQTKSISHLYNIKETQMNQLIQKMQSQGNNHAKQLDSLRLNKQEHERNLNNEIQSKVQQINLLRSEIRRISQYGKGLDSNNFDEALKSQIQLSKTLREEINKKNEQIYRLRDTLSSLRSQYDNLKSQVQVNKLKFISEKKNIEVNYQVEIQNLKNRLSMEEKKIMSFQQKIKLVLQENKKKDSFIQTYIMGKRLPQNDREFIQEFVKQYEIALSGKNIVGMIQSQSQELEKMALYNYNLMKEIAQMKQKMLLYEVVETDKISLYDSRRSKGSRQSLNFNESEIQSPSSNFNMNRTNSFKEQFEANI